jgi:ParB family transcriptional regulator, chromosome partitioning protein
MQPSLLMIRLDKLNIPTATLRQNSNPVTNERLKRSLKENGVLVPLIVHPIGRGEYDIWDGTRRVRMLRELGFAGDTLCPAILAEGSEATSVVVQMNVNQTRERLSSMAEAEALRQLIDDHGWTQSQAGAAILKTRNWVSMVLTIWRLPKSILGDLRSGRIAVSHGIVLARFVDQPRILSALHKAVLAGNLSKQSLRALALRMEQEGTTAAMKYAPKKHSIGSKSWVRIEPLQRGFRAEIHFSDADTVSAVLKQLTEVVKSR